MENTNTNDGLKYIGNGSQLVGVPTRDLSAEEVKRYGKKILLESGLYVELKYSSKPVKSAYKREAINNGDRN